MILSNNRKCFLNTKWAPILGKVKFDLYTWYLTVNPYYMHIYAFYNLMSQNVQKIRVKMFADIPEMFFNYI